MYLDRATKMTGFGENIFLDFRSVTSYYFLFLVHLQNAFKPSSFLSTGFLAYFSGGGPWTGSACPGSHPGSGVQVLPDGVWQPFPASNPPAAPHGRKALPLPNVWLPGHTERQPQITHDEKAQQVLWDKMHPTQLEVKNDPSKKLWTKDKRGSRWVCGNGCPSRMANRCC